MNKTQTIPPRPPAGQLRSSPAYMRWYRAAKKAGLKTNFRRKRTAEQTKAWRRKYQREYRKRNGAK